MKKGKGTSKCDNARIEAFVRDQLPVDEQAILEQHLDSCEKCQHDLDDHSADDDVWEKASRYLHEQAETFGTEPTELGRDVRQVLQWLAPTDDPRMLGRVASYEALGVVGSGGMGVVLKAIDPGLNRVVAIKVLAPHLATSLTARKRFAREAQAAAAITHDNVIDIYSVSEFNGLPYLVMPYARGPSLQKRLDERGPLQLEEILRIGQQIAAGLAAAHDQGLIHRDIKPANILLSDDVDRLLITDFGLARTVDDSSVTRTGVISGTPQYMSPEQARGEHLDARSDLFSLGSLLYASCTGRVPFQAESNYGVLHKIMEDQPPSIHQLNPAIPDWLCGMISKLHAKRPGDRYQTAEHVSELIKRSLAHVQDPMSVPPPAKVDSAVPGVAPSGKAKLMAFAVLLACGFLIVSLALSILENNSVDNVDLSSQTQDQESDNEADAGQNVDVVDPAEVDRVTRKRLSAVIAAIHSFADDHGGKLPPAAVPNPNLPFERQLSGFVLLLPYFGVKPSYLDDTRWDKVRLDDEQMAMAVKVYESIDLERAWDDSVNLPAARTAMPVFFTPGTKPAFDALGYGVTNLAMIRGYGGRDNGAFPLGQQVAFYDPDRSVPQISDGASETLAIGQIAIRLGPWTAASDATSRHVFHPSEALSDSSFGGSFGGAAYFVRCDGSILFVDLAGSTALGLEALVSRAGRDHEQVQGNTRLYDSATQYIEAHSIPR